MSTVRNRNHTTATLTRRVWAKDVSVGLKIFEYHIYVYFALKFVTIKP